MHKKWKGYFTIEATFILPIILFLYLLIISAALFLYCRCAISQNNFLLAMRAARFTQGEDYYGEIIYGNTKDGSWQAEDYVKERLTQIENHYPFYPARGGECKVDEGYALVETGQRSSKLLITKKVQRLNPVEMVRKGRKEQNV
ncbi:MAG: hypothetical protein PUG54_06000 [Firmicutes bacterium]|nr:hypothetical protein [Bacillota bacterium]